MNVKTVLELTTENGCFVDIIVFSNQLVLRCEERDGNETINLTKIDLTEQESTDICKALIHAQKSIEFNYDPEKTVINNYK
jgi:hypothetical protein